jgi:hypothetical protein
MPPQTIEQVLADLNAIIDRSLREAHRIGYFASLYERVTSGVRRALVAGNVFQDNPRMERLDVIFASRFLDAWSTWNQGGQPSACWQVAFRVLDDDGPLVLQHLILGMNAHINLDLGIAAATVAPTEPELRSLHQDFLTINAILARLVGVVEVELGEICADLGRIELLAPKLENKIFDFGMDLARDASWALAQELVLAPANRDALIAARDAEVARLGEALYPLHGLAGEVAAILHRNEGKDVRTNIRIVGE